LEPTRTLLPATIIQAEITSPDLGAAPVVPALTADLVGKFGRPFAARGAVRC